MNKIKEDNYKLDDLKKLDKEVKMIPLTFDLMFKNIFQRNQEIFKRFLISVLHLDLEPNDCKLNISTTELPISNYKEYKKTLDISVIINDIIFVNIEMNRSSFNKVKRRNHIYHNKFVSLVLQKGDNLKSLDEIRVIQLNLNSEDRSVSIGEDIIVPYSLKTESIYVDNDVVYLKYLDYYRRLYYNKDIVKREDELWLALLTMNTFYDLNEILTMLVEDDLRKKMIKDVKMMSMEELVLNGMVLSEEERKTLDLIYKYDCEKYDREEGMEIATVNIIKSMLNKKMSYEVIGDVTNKTIEEIKEIERSMKKD